MNDKKIDKHILYATNDKSIDDGNIEISNERILFVSFAIIFFLIIPGAYIATKYFFSILSVFQFS